MSRDQVKFTAKDLRAISGINLIMNVMDQINKVKGNLEGLGMGYVKKTGGMSRDIQQLRSIMSTTGDPIANDLLTKKINKLEEEISDQFPYLPLIKKCLREVWNAFRLAVAKHHQKYDKIIQNAMVKSLEGITVVDEPRIGLLPNKSKRNRKKVSED